MQWHTLYSRYEFDPRQIHIITIVIASFILSIHLITIRLVSCVFVFVCIELVDNKKTSIV